MNAMVGDVQMTMKQLHPQWTNPTTSGKFG